MGSTGSGNFTDYQGHSGNNPKQGGSSNETDCGKAFRTILEDVDNSQYYINHANLPVVNTQITIGFNGNRIVAIAGTEEIGNLPTKYNYLRACFEEFNYTGIVSNSSTTPINSIMINVTP